MGFDRVKSPMLQPIERANPNRGDEICPECGSAMKGKTLIASLPRGTHKEIRKVHAACVPLESPTYQLAQQVLGNVEE